MRRSHERRTPARAAPAPPPSLARRTGAVAIVNLLLAHAARVGLSTADLRARFALDPATLSDVDGRIPLTTVYRLWTELPALLSDPDLGVHLVGSIEGFEPSPRALVCLSQPTFGSAIEQTLRYERIDYDAVILRASATGRRTAAPALAVTEIQRDGALVHLAVSAARSIIAPPEDAVVFGFATLRLLGERGTGRPMPMTAVALRHAPPVDEQAYRACFGVACSFGAIEDRMTFPASYLDYPQPNASAVLRHVLRHHLDRCLERLPRSDGIEDDVRRALRGMLPEGEVGIGRVSAALGSVPRTVQRRLAREGTSLRRILDEVRREVSLDLLSTGTLPLIDVAFAAGFSDQTSFTRAFRRWTGRSPQRYRRELGKADA